MYVYQNCAQTDSHAIERWIGFLERFFVCINQLVTLVRLTLQRSFNGILIHQNNQIKTLFYLNILTSEKWSFQHEIEIEIKWFFIRKKKKIISKKNSIDNKY